MRTRPGSSFEPTCSIRFGYLPLQSASTAIVLFRIAPARCIGGFDTAHAAIGRGRRFGESLREAEPPAVALVQLVHVVREREKVLGRELQKALRIRDRQTVGSCLNRVVEKRALINLYDDLPSSADDVR